MQMLRQQGKMNMEKRIKIRMLGEFSISYGDKKIDGGENRSKKLWSMLTYLVAFREREVSQNELIDLLWPDGIVENPANTLKTLLHRVRNVLGELGIQGKDLIHYRRGGYRWNPSVPQEVDTELFDALCQKALSPGTEDEERLSACLAAEALYGGAFLPKHSLEPWVVPVQAYYQGQYLKVVCHAAGQLEQQKSYDKVIVLCRRAAQMDPYEERIHTALIRALMKSGRPQEAKSHYESVQQLFFTEFDVAPSKELTALYKEIANEENSEERTLSVLCADLEEKAAEGPFFCEYEMLKSVYRLFMRGVLRTGQTACLCLLTLKKENTAGLEQGKHNHRMERLKEAIDHTLWRGDLYTRCSVSQFLILMLSASVEAGEGMMRKISDEFDAGEWKKDSFLCWSLCPVFPAEWYKRWERRNNESDQAFD